VALGLAVSAIRFGANSESNVSDDRPDAVPVGRRERNLLERVQGVYRAAESYSDMCTLRLRHDIKGEDSDEAQLWLHYRRPGSLTLRAIHGTREIQLQIQQGESLASIVDPVVKDFHGQIVRQKIPDAIDMNVLHQAVDIQDPRNPGRIVSALNTLPVPLTISPLALLLDTSAVEGLLSSASSVEPLSSTSLRGHSVERIRIAGGRGTFVFWVDSQSALLHRIEYSSDIRRMPDRPLEPQLMIDVEQPTVNQSLADQVFERRLPISDHLYSYFVLPPNESVPDKLGVAVHGLHFVDVWGEPIDEQFWEGQVAVFVWFHRHASSEGVVRELEEVRQHFVALPDDRRDKIKFLAVCTEPSTEMSHSEVSQLARQWSTSMTVVRDLAAVGRDILGIERAPSTIVLDSSGRLQLFEEGGDTELDAEIIPVLKKLLRGEDLAADYRSHVEELWRAYERAIEAARILPGS
jgi:hypothetical protein